MSNTRERISNIGNSRFMMQSILAIVCSMVTITLSKQLNVMPRTALVSYWIAIVCAVALVGRTIYLLILRKETKELPRNRFLAYFYTTWALMIYWFIIRCLQSLAFSWMIVVSWLAFTFCALYSIDTNKSSDANSSDH